MEKYEGQGKHIAVFLVLLLALLLYSIGDDGLDGDWLALSTRTWFWIAVAIPGLHQFGVMLLWRYELYENVLTKRFGDLAFPIYKVFFFAFLIARPLSVLALSLSDRNSVEHYQGLLSAIGMLMIPILLYLFYSVIRYFGIDRAAGADHFLEDYRAKPLVVDGIHRYIPNAMYVVGFFIIWLPGLFLASRAGLVVSSFQHIFIWAHYLYTEKPDMLKIYGET